MKKVHLIYPHGKRISCPDAIGRNLGLRLEKHYTVVYHDYDSLEAITPNEGDVLVGHANPSPFTCFRLSLEAKKWSRIILITPYTHGDPRYNAFIDRFIHRCDLYLAITGNYWFGSIPDSVFAHWLPKMRHLDLAINRDDFPPIKVQFNPAGQRRLVFIGKSSKIKNVQYLSQIAKEIPEIRIGWIGGGKPIKGLEAFGFLDFALSDSKEFVRQFDFLITVSRADANPATILEAMGWGLIPICTPQSGYVGYPGIINVPLGDAQEAGKIIRFLQGIPETELLGMQAANWEALDQYFNWERFSEQVIEVIESNCSPHVKQISLCHRSHIRMMEDLAPYATWRRPLHVARVILHKIRNAFGHYPS